MAGIACGRALADAGLSPMIIDKGRSPGGRMSTRRVNDKTFDHGAQYFTARGEEFRCAIEAASSIGAVARWQAAETDGEPRYVGLPGMSGIVKHLANGLDIQCGVEINAITQTGNGWTAKSTNGQSIDADIVVCTAPAPQAADFFAGSHPFQAALSDVKMMPCWALLVAFDQTFTPGWETRRSDDTLAWIAHNGSKLGRASDCWVVHASPDWSQDFLELEKPDAAERLCAELAADFGPLPEASYIAGHRWRYAMAKKPLGKPFLFDANVYLGGDWALGPRVECAFDSGVAIARHILSA